MKFSQFNNEVVSELLFYLAENEKFESVKNLEGLSKKDIVDIIKEIASQLKDEVSEEGGDQRFRYNESELSPSALSLVSCLSPREEALLFKSFKLV